MQHEHHRQRGGLQRPRMFHTFTLRPRQYGGHRFIAWGGALAGTPGGAQGIGVSRHRGVCGESIGIGVRGGRVRTGATAVTLGMTARGTFGDCAARAGVCVWGMPNNPLLISAMSSKMIMAFCIRTTLRMATEVPFPISSQPSISYYYRFRD